MNEAKKRDYLIDFSKHVPDILLQQLIVSQAHRYTNTSSPGTLSISMGHDNGSVVTNPGTISNGISPSIQRFYGALLSIDISGFTSLSQKFDVESLKNYINGYFTRILEIVDKWGGDVVKFAGDVLYVVWPAEVDQVVDSQQQQQWIPSKNHDQRFNLGRSGSSHGSKRSNKHSNTLRSSTFAKVGHSSKKTMLKQFASDVTTRAINCGMEIIEQCGDLPVLLDSNINQKFEKSTGRLSSFVSSITSRILARNAVIAPDQQGILNNDSLAYLDIHAGVATGLMAGIDIGLDDRWEYFIIGSPISDVATAESMAKKGNIVVSAGAHSLFHPLSSICTNTGIAETGILSSTEQKIAGGVLLTCGCTQLNDQCILLRHTEMCSNNTGTIPFNDANIDRSPAMSTTMQVQASRSKLVSNAFSPANLHLYETENISLYESVCSEIRRSMAFVTPMMREAYCNALMAHCKAQSVLDPTHSEGLSQEEDIAFNVKMLEKRLPAFLQNKVRPHFFACIERGLIDQLIGHLHDVVRPDNYILFPRYNAKEENFEKALKRFLSEEKMRSRQPTIDKYAFAKILQAVDNNVAHSNSQIEIGSSHDELDEPLALEPIQKTLPVALSTKSQIVQHNIEAELRSVTVMFINIDGFDMSLIVDTSVPKDGRWTRNGTRLGVGYNPVFEFLDRTENEMMADQLILLRLQQCLEVLHRAIYENGGQMRQFMVDDKGTVCIASFGLRGSVNEDNAANALEAANAIILGLQKQNLSSSIGVTTGKVYCGLVGSMMRHEFALMGPSVNLSARLMCKATMGSILCDHETMHRDRAHDFKHVGDIKAKGYEHPVAVYCPSFGQFYHDQSPDRLYTLSSHNSSALPQHAHSAPFAICCSSFRFRMTTDPRQFQSFSSFMRTNNVPGVKKLNIMIESDYYVTDENHATLMNSLNARFRGTLSHSMKPANSGCRLLRGRTKEIEMLLRFLFTDFPKDNYLASVSGLSRIAIVVASGGMGKSAMISAVGQKLFATAKQDSKCNLAVLMCNRSSSFIASIPLNPWKLILLEILRLVNRTVSKVTNNSHENSFSSASDKLHFARKSQSSSCIVLKEESIEDYVVVADFVFSQLSPEMKKYWGLVLHLLGLVKEEEIGVDSSGGSNSDNPYEVRIKEMAVILTAIIQFCTTYTRKVLIVIIDDIQSSDVPSRELLAELWRRCTGVHFVVGLLSEAEVEYPSSPVRTKYASKFDFFGTGTEAESMSILPISENAEGITRRSTAQAKLMAVLVGPNNSDRKNRMLTLELNSLDPVATKDIVRDIVDVVHLQQHHQPSSFAAEHNREFQEQISNLVDASGGHPLYAVQLATNLVMEEDEGTMESDSATNKIGGDIKFSTMRSELMNISNMQRRVEDIICFRLGRLDAAAQTILKAATVCASHGRGFSADLIAFMLRHCPRLNTAVMGILPSHYQEELVQEGSENSRRPLEPLVKRVLLVLKILAKNSTFVRPRLIPVTGSFDPEEEEYDSFALPSIGGGDIEEGGITLANKQYEFFIPTEQATIYSLIFDELREYFHGKIAQYFYQQIAKQNLGTSMVGSLDSASKFSSIVMTESSAGNGIRSAQLLSPGGPMSRHQMMLNWLSMEQEVSFHAEQANLWPVAMRSNMEIATLERLMQNHRGMVSGLIDAFKVFKCFEQGSGEVLTPLSLLSLLNENELGSSLRRCLLNSISSQTPQPTSYCDFRLIQLGLDNDIDTVQNIFGTDVTMMSYTARLFLFLADYYLLGFGEIEYVPDILGIAVKMLLAISLLNGSDQLEQAKPSEISSPIDMGNTIQLQTNISGMAILDPVDVCHFFSTLFAYIHHDLKVIPSNVNLLLQEVEALFNNNGECGKALHSSILVNQHVLAGEFEAGLQLWTGSIGKLDLGSSAFGNIFQFGIDQRVKATSRILHYLVCYSNENVDVNAPTPIVNNIVTCLEKLLASHDWSIVLFSDLLPALMALVRLGRWATLDSWLQSFQSTIEFQAFQAHEMLAGQVLLLRHLRCWADGVHRSMSTSASWQPLDLSKLIQLVSALYFFSSGCCEENRTNLVADCERILEAASLKEEVTQMPSSLLSTLQHSVFFSCEELVAHILSSIFSFLSAISSSSLSHQHTSFPNISSEETVKSCSEAFRMQLGHLSQKCEALCAQLPVDPVLPTIASTSYWKHVSKLCETCFILVRLSMQEEEMNILCQQSLFFERMTKLSSSLQGCHCSSMFKSLFIVLHQQATSAIN